MMIFVCSVKQFLNLILTIIIILLIRNKLDIVNTYSEYCRY